MYKAKILDIAGFSGHRALWNELAASMEPASVFCSWEWVRAWLDICAVEYEPVILCVTDGERTAGFLPLAMRRSSVKGNELGYCGAELYPDHVDIICRKEDANGCAEAVFGFLSAEFRDWDVLEVESLTSESSLVSAASAGYGLNPSVRICSGAPYMDLRAGLEGLGASLDGRLRSTIKRKGKLAEKAGIVYAAAENSEIPDALKTLFSLHARRAEKKEMATTFAGEKLERFHGRFASLAAENGWLWLRSLRADEKTISSIYCFAFGGRVSYYQIGLDPEWEQYSPGTLLMNGVISEAARAGYKEFDFLRGNEEYKKSWTKLSRELYAVTAYNSTVRGAVSRTVSISKGLIKRNIRKIVG